MDSCLKTCTLLPAPNRTTTEKKQRTCLWPSTSQLAPFSSFARSSCSLSQLTSVTNEDCRYHQGPLEFLENLIRSMSALPVNETTQSDLRPLCSASQKLDEYAKIYGPVFSFRYRQQLWVVVANYKARTSYLRAISNSDHQLSLPSILCSTMAQS